MQQARVSILLFAAGIFATLFLPQLPDSRYLASLFTLAVVLLWSRRLAWAGYFLLGLGWHIGYGHHVLATEIPKSWEDREIVVRGVVTGLPQHIDNGDGFSRTRFEFEAQSAQFEGRPLPLSRPLLLRLSWYRGPAIEANQRWQLSVRLRRPRGMANPGGFDYRVWLLSRGVGASGKVIEHPHNHSLGRGARYLSGLRQWYRVQLQNRLEPGPGFALTAALAIGDKRQLDARQRDILARTGTSHLMVISGLHIGLCAVLGYWLVYALASCRPRWVQAGAAQRSAALGAVLLAAFYAALAGFSVPTTRALAMVLVYLAARQYGRETSSSHVLLLALFVVLAGDPLAVTEAGFWLSFAAVAILLAPAARDSPRGGKLLAAYRLQLRVLLGLCPLLALLLGQTSVLAPLVNMLAIPLLGFTIVPLLLAAMLLLPLSSAAGGLMLDGVNQLLEVYWAALSALAQFAETWSLAALYPSPAALALAAVATLLFMLPRGLPGRSAWPLLILPLLLPDSRGGDVLDVTVLDVGQGTSVVVRTREHVLVYDTGPAYSGGFDAGAAVLLPFLRRQGIARVDRLVISHGDTDHSGGAASLFKGVAVDSWMAPAEIGALGKPDQTCHAGTAWQWDGVEFEILHPGRSLPASSNNQSCVLKIESPSMRYLLVGDIERSVERSLVRKFGPALETDILLVPHHGSDSSSSYDFTWFTRPQMAVASAGFGNRFGHPTEKVVMRYRQQGSAVVNTADTGALQFGDDGSYRPWRWFYTRYWQHYPCSLPGKVVSSWMLEALVAFSATPVPCETAATNAVDDGFLW